MRTVNCGLITKHALKIVSDSLIEPEQTTKWPSYEVEKSTLRSPFRPKKASWGRLGTDFGQVLTCEELEGQRVSVPT